LLVNAIESPLGDHAGCSWKKSPLGVAGSPFFFVSRHSWPPPKPKIA